MILNIDWFTRQYFRLDGTNNIWVAYSGGLDSTVLLQLCWEFSKLNPAIKLQAIHINHGLQAESAEWAEHCQQTCNNLNIPLHTSSLRLDLTSGESIEELARHARRAVWQQLLPSNASLVLAHHAQDQVETILHRLLRGAGPTGLAAMQEVCSFGAGKLMRPLLKISKQELEDFAVKKRLSWITDTSNSNVQYERNYIRNLIMPSILQRWPTAIKNILRTGELCAENTLLLTETVAKLLEDSVGTKKRTLSIKKLLALNEAKCFAVLRQWIKNNHKQMPSRQQLYKIKTEVMLAKIDADPILNLTEFLIRRYRDDLYLLAKEQTVMAESIVISLTEAGKVKLKSGKTLRISHSIGSGICLPTAISEITICFGSRGKRAKKIFQQYNIPPWQRYDFLLIFVKDKLISIVGLWIRSEAVAKAGQVGITINLD